MDDKEGSLSSWEIPLFQRRTKETNLVFQDPRDLYNNTTHRLFLATEVEIKDREPRGKGRVFRLITGNKKPGFYVKELRAGQFYS